MHDVNRIVSLLEQRGDSQYGGEAVSQLEHALQSAWLAEQEQAAPELIVAALLHDIGHLLHDLPDDAPDLGIDDAHEKCPEQVLWPCRHRAHSPPCAGEAVSVRH
jgi:predicted HD phosphohydrolase